MPAPITTASKSRSRETPAFPIPAAAVSISILLHPFVLSVAQRSRSMNARCSVGVLILVRRNVDPQRLRGAGARSPCRFRVEGGDRALHLPEPVRELLTHRQRFLAVL